MLVLLLLAKGWAITKTEVTNKFVLFSVWTIYGIVHILLYFWDRVSCLFVFNLFTWRKKKESWEVSFFFGILKKKFNEQHVLKCLVICIENGLLFFLETVKIEN